MYEDLIAHFANLPNEPEPAENAPPSNRKSFPAGSLEITGGRMTFYDSWGSPDEGVSVKVPSGTYNLTVDVQSYGNDGRIARVIATLPDVKTKRGNCRGTFGVDVASAAICDGDVLDQFSLQHSEEWENWIDSFIQRPFEEVGLLGTFPCEPAATDIFYCSTGFGDGSYPVYELLEAGKVVGAEVIFLLPDQSYFGPGPGEDDA